MIGIYKILCLVTNLNYIGYSTNLKNRENTYKNLNVPTQPKIKESLELYGWDNHKFDILEICNKKELKFKEKYWIEYFDSYYNGLNENKGGGGPINHTDKTKQKIRIFRLGRKQSSRTILKRSLSLIGKNTKSVIQYDLQGNKINKFNSIKEACISINKPNREGDITSCCKNKQKTAFGYIWRYKNDPLTKFSKSKFTHIRKNILQCDLQGNIIKEWKSAFEAGRKLKVSGNSISDCLNKRQKTAYGYKWKYKPVTVEEDGK